MSVTLIPRVFCDSVLVTQAASTYCAAAHIIIAVRYSEWGASLGVPRRRPVPDGSTLRHQYLLLAPGPVYEWISRMIGLILLQCEVSAIQSISSLYHHNIFTVKFLKKSYKLVHMQ
jgi:hypothetical protein